MTDIHAFPESAGVYLFYSDSSLVPLYIGKSVSLRQRILSHFQGDYAHAKEFNMAQQVTRVEIIPTAGELSALMLESELIKEKMPIYNRRLRRKTHMVGFKVKEQAGYLEIVLVREQVDEKHHLNSHPLIGAFSSIVKAKSALSALVRHFHLCPRLCHLEPGLGACFSYQLKRCQGACMGMESAEFYNRRVVAALKEHQEVTWPYRSAVAIKEHCPINKITQFLVFHQWRYLGAVQSEEQLDSFGELPLINRADYYDTYKILVSYLKKHAYLDDLIELA
jgi:DNA polymerase-3 subunit epsilon